MLSDWTFYGMVTLAVSILAILATFAAPYFAPGARIAAFITGTSEFRADAPSQSLAISVTHNGNPVDKRLILLFVSVENTGRPDITQAHFVDPVEILAPEGVEVLSIEAAADDGVGPETDLHGNSARVKWRILKSKETIKLRAILATDSTLSADDIWRQTKIVARLVDVKTGQGFFREHPRLRGWLGAIVFGAFAAYGFGRGDTIEQSASLVVADTRDGPRALDQVGDQITLCKIHNSPAFLESCTKTSVKDGLDLYKGARIGSGSTGKGWWEWFWVLVMITLNANSGWLLFRPRSQVARPPKAKAKAA